MRLDIAFLYFPDFQKSNDHRDHDALHRGGPPGQRRGHDAIRETFV